MATNEKLCPSGHPNHPDDQFCGLCGQTLAVSSDSPRTTILYCTSGHPASPYDLHCGQCGAPVRPPIVPTPPTRPNPPSRPVVRPFTTAIPPRRSNTTRNGLIVGGIAVLCIILVVAGGRAVKASRSSSGGSSSAASQIRSESELSRMLLTEADLAYDWSEISQSGSSSESVFCADMDDALESIDRKYSNSNDVSAHFSKSDSGPLITEGLISPSSSKYYSEVKFAVRSCLGKSWTVQSSDGVFDIEMLEVSLPKFGDESFAVKLSVSGQFGDGYVWVIVSQVNSINAFFIITELTYTAFGGRTSGASRVSNDEVASIVRAGVERIRKYS